MPIGAMAPISRVDFCERWDQSSFDPDYPMDPLESFAGDMREVFARNAWDPGVVRGGAEAALSSYVLSRSIRRPSR
jgi:predicted HD phosphohydrolase